MRIHESIPRYTDFDPQIPVWCVTPGEGRCIHRFFDTSPISHGGTLLAVLRVPQETRAVAPGEEAQVVVIDLETGVERVVYTTCGWEAQMGANINWGRDDRTLLFNDVDRQTWQPFGVQLDWPTGKAERFAHGIYHASPDGRWAVVGDLTTMRWSQAGYGVVIPDELVPRRIGAPDDTGVFLTDLDTGESRMLLSIGEAFRRATPYVTDEELGGLESYVFHTKFSPDGSRIMFTTRRLPLEIEHGFGMDHSQMWFDIFTIRPDGTELRNPVPYPFWRYAGHHTTWTPDSRSLTLNLDLRREGMKIWIVGHDGADFRLLVDFAKGSGHPTLHRDGRHVLTDSYSGEGFADAEGSIPLRWLDLAEKKESHPVRVRLNPRDAWGDWRIDPHPAWDRTWRYVAFNGSLGDTRRVFLADFGPLLGD